MIKKIGYTLFFATVIIVMWSCSATKYVPQGSYLLRKNELALTDQKKRGDDQVEINRGQLEEYIQQRPNKKLLWMDLPLAFYNATDTVKNSWWHRFWRNTMGQPPVIFDSALVKKSDTEIDLFLISNGYFNAQVQDTVSINKRRMATVKYQVNAGEPYIIDKVKYKIADEFVDRIVMMDTVNSLIKSGMQFRNALLEEERLRISNYLRNEGFWGFGISYINYLADSTVGNHRVNLTINIRKQTERVGNDGKEVLSNHPLYKLNRIIVNSAYDPTLTIDDSSVRYDSVEYNGIEILYDKRLVIRPKILTEAIRLSPNEIFSQSAVANTNENLRRLGYSANMTFSPVSEVGKPTMITLSDPNYKDVSTVEKRINCYIQCTPSMRHGFNVEFEGSTTADYYSVALALRYSNRNLFKGAETFDVTFRGAYEFMKSSDQKNAYEFGVTASLSAPRFWLPLTQDQAARYKNKESKISVSYSVQRRPFYHRTLSSGVFGYSWTFKGGARFTINPVDINIVSVPWVDSSFIKDIENPYLRNSYQSQLIAGASTSYYYTTSKKTGADGITLKIQGDANGNLIRGLTSLFGNPTERDGEKYYNLFGLKFAQYVRATAEISGRYNASARSQIAWRFLLAGGYAYGNSSVVPFERLFFAGGSNSMRGWHVRTLGPGGVLYTGDGVTYPNQLGDMRMEANFEYRVHLIYGLSMALFLDAGNIWVNSVGETRPEARFNVNRFYKQIALNTGAGIRYNIADLMILRLDWGLKLHNPNMPKDQRWFTNMAFNQTAFHFAIGLPF